VLKQCIRVSSFDYEIGYNKGYGCENPQGFWGFRNHSELGEGDILEHALEAKEIQARGLGHA
jgi:hypothetical protein